MAPPDPLGLLLKQGPSLGPIFGPGSEGSGNLPLAFGAGMVDELAARIFASKELMDLVAGNRGSFGINLFDPSEEFGSWTASNALIGNRIGLGPYNAWNAGSITEDNTNNTHIIEATGQPAIVLAGIPKVVSAFVKPFEATPRPQIYLGLEGSGGAFVQANYDLGSGLVTGGLAGTNVYFLAGTVEPKPLGWSRISLAIAENFSGPTSLTPYLGLLDGDGNDTYLGDNASGVFTTAWMVEDGVQYPSPYKPTPTDPADEPGYPRVIQDTPTSDLMRYVYDLASYLVAERQRRFS